MILTGLILILLARLLAVPLLNTLGLILVVVGVVAWLLGAFGRPIGPRAHYW